VCRRGAERAPPPPAPPARPPARRRRRGLPHWWCPRAQPWTLAWLNPLELLPGRFACFAANFRLACGPAGRCSPPPGVAVRPRPGFDSAMRVLPLGPEGVFGRLVEALEALGWRRDRDLVAHLYDWRHGNRKSTPHVQAVAWGLRPCQGRAGTANALTLASAPPPCRLSPLDHLAPGGAFDRLRADIERAVAAAGGRPASVVALSMGAPYFTLFLARHVDAAWHRRHVASLTSLSGVWGGTPAAALGLVSGQWGGGGPAPAPVVALFRGLPVLPWLLPAEAAYGNFTFASNAALRRGYAAAGGGALLRDAGARGAAAVWAAVRPLAMAGAEEPPGVAVACFVGDGVPTPVEARYLDPRFREVRVRYSAAGDGTVAAQGLAACGRWAGRQAEAVEVRTFQGVQHAGILADDRAFREVLLALTQAGGGGAAAQRWAAAASS
jgi:hypothetical protein